MSSEFASREAGETEPAASSTTGQKSLSATQKRLHRLGLVQPEDFVVHLPLRYEDETRVVFIRDVHPGQAVQVEGTVVFSEVRLRPRRQLVAMIEDATGQLNLRWLNFYPSQQRQVKEGARIRIRGEVRNGFHGLEIIHPRVSAAGGVLPEALTPVYPTTEGLAQAVLRRAVARAMAQADLTDSLPQSVRARYQLIEFKEAIQTLHHPTPDIRMADLLEREHPAWRRIKFDELLAQQLSLALARAARLRQRARPLRESSNDLTKALRECLPFTPTQAQEKAIVEIIDDLRQAFPMHRLLQGDVGSGKTLVAAMAAAHAIGSGAQVAIMAPTEILASQHYQKLVDWLKPLGVSVAWLTGSLGVRERRDSFERIESGKAQLIVGTQALIQEKVTFHDLGLVILDEQHRFGVGQRLELSRKGENQSSSGPRMLPHQLSMSATPIPRTLAMTFFADLDVSVLDELPPGRSPVLTKLVAEARREEVLMHVKKEIEAGRQAYWVCPLVEESEALQLQTAVETYERLRASLPNLKIGLLHGRMKAAEKAQVMGEFRDARLDLLVATTVIEVGVDVPNASLMIIEHAERFGLAQLHQLRGRVGRGAAKSVCVLLYQEPLSMIARERLRAMYETNDGFEIARRDLEQRGPGEFLGVRQSGAALLRYADAQQDSRLVEQAQELARELLDRDMATVQRHLDRWARNKQDFLRS